METSYKEKYEQALSVARETYQSQPMYREWLEKMFPELKESEDEKIRKEIIDFATKANNGATSILANNYNFNKWIVWLGKQGEQKPVISDDALREGIAHFGITQYQIDNWLKKYVYIEKLGEQKQELLTKEKALKNSPFVEQKPNCCDEQKPNPCENCSIATNNCQNFPCTIRDGEQKPAEWSEEDEKTIHLACEFIRHHSNRNDSINGIDCPILIERLKSLRPQSQWRPSESQIFALESVIDSHPFANPRTKESLQDLLKQLKAL